MLLYQKYLHSCSTNPMNEPGLQFMNSLMETYQLRDGNSDRSHQIRWKFHLNKYQTYNTPSVFRHSSVVKGTWQLFSHLLLKATSHLLHAGPRAGQTTLNNQPTARLATAVGSQSEARLTHLLFPNSTPSVWGKCHSSKQLLNQREETTVL